MLIFALAVILFAAGWRWSERSTAGTFTVDTETAVRQAEPAPPSVAPTRLDLNTAAQTDLEALPEIGPTRAQAIVDYRAEHGPFRYVEQLLDVPGIGESTLEAIADYLTIGEAEG